MTTEEGYSGYSKIPLIVLGFMHMGQALLFEADFHSWISTPFFIVKNANSLLYFVKF